MSSHKKVNIFSWATYHLIKETSTLSEIAKNLYILRCMEGNASILGD